MPVTITYPLVGNSALEYAIKQLEAAVNSGSTITSTVSTVPDSGLVIVFDTPKTGDYSIFGQYLSDDGEIIGYVITGKTIDGFTITPTPAIAGTFEWFTLLKS